MLRDVPKVFLGLAVLFAVILFIMAFGVFGVGGFLRSTADYRGETEKREQVEAQGEYRIAKYDKFHNLCNDIQAKNEDIQLAEETLSGKQKEKVVYAHSQTKNSMIAEYNSMANQDYTAGDFRSSELPYQIDEDDMEVECN